ncbi:MAG: hypothetical protein ACI31A_01930 [Candidatus Limisoma sp.]
MEVNSLTTSGNWSVYVNDPKKEAAWEGKSLKIISIPPQDGGNTENVYLDGDIWINDRVFIGSSLQSAYTTSTDNSTGQECWDLPAGKKAKLYIKNNTDHDIIIYQNIWGNRCTTTDSGNGNKYQEYGSNVLFTVWGDCELIIDGSGPNNPNAKIIIDGGSTRLTNEWTSYDKGKYNQEPSPKIMWGLVESAGTLTLKNVEFRNVVFAGLNGKAADCEWPCIKLNSIGVNRFKLGKTTLENVSFNNVESPGGGGCILSCYGDLTRRSVNNKESCKITINGCTVTDTKQYSATLTSIDGGSSASPFLTGLMRFNDKFVGNVDITNCVFTDNYAGNACAGIVWNPNKTHNPTLTINDCSFERNSATRGSCIDSQGGKVVITGNAIFKNNVARNHEGGAVVGYYGADISFEDCSFEGNTANWHGGAVYVTTDDASKNGYSKLTINGNPTFIDNHCGLSGGAVTVNTGSHLVINGEAKFQKNYTTGTATYKDGKLERYEGGGAIGIMGQAQVTINKGIFEGNYHLPDNSAHGRGGAIMVWDAGTGTSDYSLQINEATFTGNKSRVGGGALFFMSNSSDANYVQKSYIKNATFRDNVSGAGGAIGFDGYSDGGFQNIQVTLENNVIENNRAAVGGGIAIQEATLSYKGGVIRNNIANQRRNMDFTPDGTDETIKTDDGQLKTTGYKLDFWGENSRSTGWGGGIALDYYGKLSFDSSNNRFGIYNNLAQRGGDDILNDGTTGTSVELPDLWSSSTANLDGLNLPNELKKNLRWMQDFPTDESNYSTAIKGGLATCPGRYRDLLAEKSDKLKDMIIVNNTYTGYVAVALGYQFVYADITKQGLRRGETTIFTLHNNEDGSGTPYMTLAFTNTDGDESTVLKKTVALTPGYWTVKETNWSYTYNNTSPSSVTNNIQYGAGNTFTFTNAKKSESDVSPNAESYIQNDFKN